MAVPCRFCYRRLTALQIKSLTSIGKNMPPLQSKLSRRHCSSATSIVHEAEASTTEREEEDLTWHNTAKRKFLAKKLASDVAKSAELKSMEDDVTDPELLREIAAYYKGRRKLAEMMGCDPDRFTDQDVEDSIRYLLPSNLTAMDARPFLKHPLEYYPMRNKNLYDTTGRPVEAAFYTGVPVYYNLVYDIMEAEKGLNDQLLVGGLGGGVAMVSSQEEQELFQQHMSQSRWLSYEEMQNYLKEDIIEEQYTQLVGRLKALASHPLAYKEKQFMRNCQRIVVSLTAVKNVSKLNADDVSTATGRRKTAVATVEVKRGSGQLSINHCGLVEFFPLIQHRQQLLFPLILLESLGKFDVTAKVFGGGTTGKAGAIRHGLSKALAAFSEHSHSTLEAAGLLLRDPRMVERKKPGQMKARRKFAWVKR